MEREVSDCGWCQSAGSVWRGRCQICNVVVAESSSLATKATTRVKRAAASTKPSALRTSPTSGKAKPA